jgi:hypothetical protein
MQRARSGLILCKLLTDVLDQYYGASFTPVERPGSAAICCNREQAIKNRQQDPGR